MNQNIDIYAPIVPQNYLDVAQKTNLEQQGNQTLKTIHKEIESWVKKDKVPWEDLFNIKEVKDLIEAHFKMVRNWIDETFPKSAPKPKAQPEQKTAKASPRANNTPKTKKTKSPSPKKTSPALKTAFSEALPPALRFIRRYKNLHNKYLTRRSLTLFLDSLQKAILTKEVGKKSKYAEEIRFIQKSLVELYNGSYITLDDSDGHNIKLDPKKQSKFQAILDAHKIRPAVRLLKRFVGLVTQPFVPAKMERLQKELLKAINTKKIKISGSRPDPLAREIKQVMIHLGKAISSGKLEISERSLNGISKAVNTSGHCQTASRLNGPSIPSGSIVPSTDFSLDRSNRIGLPDYYKSIFGDLAHGFKMLIRGPRGAGKSTLAVQFANWMAKAGNRVLYIADEEGFSDTMHDRLERMNLKHPNLDLTDKIPQQAQLWPYDCIFIDSITSANMDISGLEAIAKEFKHTGKSLVLVGQVTTSGELRGGTRVPHEVDVEVETFKKGEPGQEIRYARTEKSRYGSGGMQEINTNDNYYETYFSHSA